ncbi:MAG: aspartate kinase [Clostridiales bacterium]|nr:aspartate kinase [Clostridiales bacterium]
MNSIVVLKFGGTSVGTIERIKATAEKIIEQKNKGFLPVIVVSAMGSTTNELLGMANQISHNPKPREMDVLLSTGEQITIALLSMALSERGYDTISLTGAQCGIITSSSHQNARIDNIDTSRIINELKNDRIVIAAGFQGVTGNGDITTLGRGGSDTTAVALAASLKAKWCDIYTDVSGVYSADPRKVESATKIDYISYDEMLEMAKLGAGVLHPRAVELARAYSVNLRVRSSFSNEEGTVIGMKNNMEKAYIRGVSSQDDIVRVSVVGVPDEPGIAFKLFKVLSENHIRVDMIIQNLNHNLLNDISFTTTIESINKTKEIVENFVSKIGAEGIKINDSVSKISVIGTGIMGYGETASIFFKTLSENGINIQMISTSETRISCIIDNASSQLALKNLHKVFIENVS